MLQGRRFVIFGLNHLAVHVSRALVAQRAEVVVLRRLDAEGEPFVRRLPSAVHVVDGVAAEDDAALLERAGLAQATTLLTISRDDLDNLRMAVAAREVAPQVPVVLRAFDPALADQLEQGLNIRRAYSTSALAAPAFIAAACGDDVVETLRLGDGEVPLCRLTVRAGSPLAGQSTAQIRSRFGCAIVARRSPPSAASSDGDTEWEPVCGEADGLPLAEGESVLAGGLLVDVLRLTLINAGWLSEGGRRTAPSQAGRRRAERHLRWPRRLPAHRHPTLLPYVTAALLSLLALSVAVFARALHLRAIDALYFVITTATTTGYGDYSLKDGPDWLKLFGCLIMLSGGALLGILFSYLAAVATAERLDEMMGRRAGRMSGHVVLAGLGNLGYRVARLLAELGMGVVVLELAPGARYAEAVRAHAPVLAGDSRLAENLERASIRQAVAFIACTNDDLANIQACLNTRRLGPQVATVARVYDDALGARLAGNSAIDRALSASQCAVSAFVGAATDELALRPLALGALQLTARRYHVDAKIDAAEIDRWHDAGVRLLAYRAADGSLCPPAPLPWSLGPGAEVILCGPSDAVRNLVGAAETAA